MSHATTRQNITAIIYDRKGRVLSVGKNSYTKTHPLQAKFAEKSGNPHKIYLHAEIDALVKLRYTDKAYSIHVIRLSGKGQPMNAKPCSCCSLAVQSFGIKKITHT